MKCVLSVLCLYKSRSQCSKHISGNQSVLCAFDSFRQEEAGQGYVDFHEGFGNPGRALRLVWMTQNWSLNQLVLYREYQRNLQRAGQYGLADGKCEGHSRAESDRIRSEGGAIG